MSGSTTAGAQVSKPTAQQANAQARALVLANGLPMTQKIFSQTLNPQNGGTLNITPRNVGLIRGFWVKVAATVTNAAAIALTPTPFGIANLLSQIVFYDLSNNMRINTTGWHMNLINSVKGRQVFGGAVTTDSPMGYGSVMKPFKQPSIAATVNATGAVEMWYYIPLAYHNKDLRGAVYAGVLNATMNLQLTINPTPVVPSTGDQTLAVYTGAAGATGSITAATVTVYQDYLDQLPVGKNGSVILPYLDISAFYELKNTNLTGIAVGQDFPIPYSNFRDYLSTCVIFDNGGSLAAGTDVNYFALQSSNFTNIFNIEPDLQSVKTRQVLQDDCPIGTYYFPSRQKPISTQQYGNMELIVNAATVNTNAVMLIGFESIGMKSSVIPAGSLPGG
jgi:hypothetical protein